MPVTSDLVKVLARRTCLQSRGGKLVRDKSLAAGQ